jgi:hypothetical protein
MTKVLVGYPNFGDYNTPYMLRCMEELITFEMDVTVVLFTTIFIDVSFFKGKLNVIQKKYDDSIGINLQFEHRKFFKDNVNNYDLFLYSDNDHLYTRETIETFMEITEKLDDDHVCGMFQFEIDDRYNNEEWCVVGQRHGKYFTMKDKVINGEKYWTPANFHQAGYLFTKKHLRRLIESGKYNTNRHSIGMGATDMVAATSSVYCTGVLKKVLPHDKKLFRKLLVHHLPNKYVKNKIPDNVVTIKKFTEML